MAKVCSVMNREEKVDHILDMATKILKLIKELQIDPAMGFAILGNAFARMSTELGFDSKEFRNICNEMADIYDES